MLCYCGSKKDFANCCNLLIQGQKTAKTPLELMKSRYSAYCSLNGKYLFDTLHQDFRDGLSPAILSENTGIKWKKLNIIFEAINLKENKGFVEFKAYYIENEQNHILHERSEFVLENGKWFYTTGEFNPKKYSPNNLCLCGSKKKFKQCCNKK